MFPPPKMCNFYLFIVAPIQLVLAASLCGILAAEMINNNNAHFTHGSVVEIVSLSLRVMRSSSVGPPDMNYSLMCNLKKATETLHRTLCKQADTCLVHLLQSYRVY